MKRRDFCVMSLGGLIFGGAYTWRGLFWEFYGIYLLGSQKVLTYYLQIQCVL